MIDGLAVQAQGPGDVPAVLLVHGFPDTSELWRHQVSALLDAGHRVITMDLRGFGASDKPAAVHEYAPARVLSDLEMFQFDVAEKWLLQDSAAQLRELLGGHPDGERAVARLRQPGAMTCSLGLYRAWAPPASLVGHRPAAASFRAPAVGVWGSADRFLTEQQMTGSAEEAHGEWRYDRIDGAGHWLPLEAPDTVPRLSLDFLSQTAGAERAGR
ncbi:alpha/beta fold hydrolase [Streptomyces sp. NPDC003996]